MAYHIKMRRSSREDSSSDVGEEILWDSGRVGVDELLDIVSCRNKMVIDSVGNVMKWRVSVWD